MIRMRRTYPNGIEIEDELTVVPIYMTRTRNRNSTNGQSSVGNYEALFRPSVDIIESDTLIYNDTETAILTYEPIIYKTKSYLLKVTFG